MLDKYRPESKGAVSSIAVLGATSQIASDLIRQLSGDPALQLFLFSRRPESVAAWLAAEELAHARIQSLDYDSFLAGSYDAVVNCVGVGDPGKAVAMAASILEITDRFDAMALAYLRRRPDARYVFLSSGAAFGSAFLQPVTDATPCVIPVNALGEQDWYSVAKVMAECRHRALPDAAIIDLRVFNYFSAMADPAPRFFANDILRAVRDRQILATDGQSIFRDFITPADFTQLIRCLIAAPRQNAAFDAYSGGAVEKFALLDALSAAFGLRYEIVPSRSGRKTEKIHYYSLSRRASALGYVPAFTSLEGLTGGYHRYLSRQGRN